MREGQSVGKRSRNHGGDKKSLPSIAQIWSEFKQLKNTVAQMGPTLAKIKRILQVEDNWHSRVSKMINHEVEVFTSSDMVEDHGNGVWFGIPFVGKLLWTDRYNIGVEIDDEEEIFNKGHVVRIRRAKERN